MLKEEHVIGSAFLVQPWKKLTYKDIQKITGKKSKGYIYKAINRLVREDIINTEQVGRSILYSLNLDSLKTKSYIGFLNEYLSWKSKHMPHRTIEKIVSKISAAHYVFIVTGSYAKKKQTPKSDLDVTIICDDNTNPKSIMAEIAFESEVSIPVVEPYVFTRKEFLQMLLDKGENYGKEVARHNSIFYGGAIYYTILHEALMHGFRG